MKSPVEILVESAARRRLYLLGLEHSALALIAVLAGTILLLLLGTQVLNWPWLVLLAAVGLAIALQRIHRNRASNYRLAQMLDRHLASHDLFSTAWYLLRESGASHTPLAQSQIGLAEHVAPTVDPRALFPFTWRRSWTLACALAAVAFGLFAVRYLVTRSLDFRASLLPIPTLSISTAVERIEKLLTPNHKHNPSANELAKINLPRIDDGGARDSQPGRTPASTRTPQATQTPGNNHAQSRNPDPHTGSQEPSTQGQSEASSKSPNGDQNKSQSLNASNENRDRTSQNSLSDRMRQALSGLMEKMRSQSGSQSNREQSAQQPNSQKSSSGANNSQAAENANNSQQPQSANRAQNAQSPGQPQATEKSALAQNQSAAQGASKKGSDSQSGIGRQDGAKTLREAEQLRALGKLDEIIGKRSAALTGDMTVETRSSRQQLQTQYTGRIAQHSDKGGLIRNDEVPLAMQDYVRAYMEQVHKQANSNP